MIKEWFQFRELVDDNRFGAYFNRLAIARAPQYLAMLRVETTEWDPMVTEYMERQYLRSETRAGRKSETSSGSTSASGQHSDTETGRDVTDASSSVTDHGETEGAETHSGTDSVSRTGSVDREHAETVSSTDSRSTNRQTTSQALTGSTPDSQVYAAGGIPANGLDWRYASGQSETKGGETTTDNDQASTSTSGTDGETSTGSDTTTYGHRINTTGETDTTSSGTSQTVLNRNGQRQGSTSSSGTTSGELSGTTNENVEGDDRERYTGRHGEAPQDLLDRARSYIIKSNAFMWLVDQLDMCFLSVYNY